MIRLSRVSKTYLPKTLSSNLKNLLFGKIQNQNTGGTKAVTSVSFEITEGEIVGLIGPNGAGKTTIMKVLTGLLLPSSGEVFVDSYKPANLDKDFRKLISFFSGSHYFLDEGIIIKDSFEDKLHAYGLKPLSQNDSVDWLLENSNTSRFLNKVPEELSTGQRTLIEVVYSLIHAPKYVFFDEPTLGLDLGAVILFKKLVRNLNTQKSTTFIITSHDLQNVVDVSHRIILINGGRVIVDKPTQSILRDETLDRRIEFTLTDRTGTNKLPPNASLDYPKLSFNTSKEQLGDSIKEWLTALHFSDLRITEPPIEEIFSKYYAQKTKK